MHLPKLKPRLAILGPATLLGLVTAAYSSVDLGQIGHIPAKGRVQDQQANQVVGALVAEGPDAIQFLLAKLVDETEVKGEVLDFWPHVQVGDVALVVLLDLFTAPDNVHATIPGLSWDAVLDRRNPDTPAWELLDRYVSAHGRKGLQSHLERLLNPYKGRIAWDGAGRCFRPTSDAPPNNPIKLSVHPVTPLAFASVAPVRPAAYRVR